MQGVHAFEPKTKASIDLESFVAADHFLRKIDHVLGTAFVRDLTASRYAAQQGRPSIDPEVYTARAGVLSIRPVAVKPRLRRPTFTLLKRWSCVGF